MGEVKERRKGRGVKRKGSEDDRKRRRSNSSDKRGLNSGEDRVSRGG